MIDSKIFRDNDIRGVYPTDLDEGVMYKIGQSIKEVFKAKKVAVGHDMRVSSPSLTRALVDGLLSQGIDVITIGMISTPMSYFASAILDVDLSLIVSSSHNPKEYNGLILTKKGGIATTQDELDRLLDSALSPTSMSQEERGKEEEKEILNDWLTHVFSLVDVKKIRPMKVVFDCGNGVEAVELLPALERLPQIKEVKMYFEPDGNFPNHIPNPLLSETLEDLKKKVVEEKADLGLSYDGDGDRVIMVDEKGTISPGSEMSAFLAKHLLLTHREESPAMLYTNVMSKIYPETVSKYGGRPMKVHVGHSFIKAKMRDTNALFAGEHSGHFYFRENYYSDSALVGTLKILEAISLGDGHPVSEQLKEFRKYSKHEELSIEVEDRTEFIDIMETELEGLAKIDRPKKVSHRDGVTFEFSDFWFNLRPSGTEPVVRFNIEAYRKKDLEQKTEFILQIANKTGKVKHVVHTHA